MKTKLVIFGLTGDLGRRKLIPALDSLLEKNEILPDEIEVIGVSRREIEPFEILESSLGFSRAENSKLSQILSFFEMNLAEKADYEKLKNYLEKDGESQILLYLSVPPASAAQISTLAGKAGLNGENVKILFEKPFGIDLKSAHEFVSRTAEFFKEKQIFRIDHYLAKEMAQNLLILRHKNALFSQIWNGKSISKVQIVASEQIGIEGRGTFYEQSGALRDFIQSHLIQILALFLADFPKSWSDLPGARFKALEQIEILQNPEENAIRGQYQTYREEVENPKSCVETFAKIRLFSKDENWKNVPFELISGKNLSEKRSEIRIHLRKTGENQANLVQISLDDSASVKIELATKIPGLNRRTEIRNLSFSYDENATTAEAYEKVLAEAIRNEKVFFAESDEILRAWEILQPALDFWQNSKEETLRFYKKGTDWSEI